MQKQKFIEVLIKANFRFPGLIRWKGIFALLGLAILSLTVSGCGASEASAQSIPTAWVLVTANPNPTATPTPFQPSLPTTIPPTDTPVPSATPIPSETPTAEVLLPTADPAQFTPTPTAIDLSTIPTAMPVSQDRDTINFLLLGSDTRGGVAFRTDTIVVAIVRPSTGEVSLISIPRDFWAYIPGRDYNRINTAYLYGDLDGYPGGGAALLKDTIMYNLGIPIDHTAMVDFNGFRNIVDAIGGVEVPVSCPYTDWRLIDPNLDPENEYNWALYTVGPGVVQMDGDLALWYARSRKRSNDFDRGRRQQEVLRAIYDQAISTDLLKRLPELYTQFNSTVQTDLGFTDILSLAPLSLHLTNADIRGYYINTGNGSVNSWITPEGAYVLLPNDAVIQQIVQQAMSPHEPMVEETGLVVEIRNGSPYDGWDELAAQRLNYAGYETTIKPADTRDQQVTYLYDFTMTQDTAESSQILAALGLPQSSLISVPTEGAGVPYVVLMGADYQPCFDPNDTTR